MGVKNFLAAVVFAAVALGFSVGSAAEVAIENYDAAGIYSDLETGTRSDKTLFTVKNFRRETAMDSTDPISKTWMCDFVEKSTGNSDAKIAFVTNENDRVISIMVVSKLESASSNENLAEALITFSFAMTAYFGLAEAELQELAVAFMTNPSAGKWSHWDSAHKKCVHVISGMENAVVGFVIYATDSENE